MRQIIFTFIILLGLTSCLKEESKGVDKEVLQLMEALNINALNDTVIELQYLQCVLNELKSIDSLFLTLGEVERAKFLEVNYPKINKCDSLLINIDREADFNLVNRN